MIEQEIATLSMGDESAQDHDGGVVAELTSRHGRSQQSSSRQVLAVLEAILAVLQAEGMPRTPTTMFAAIMSALDKQETQASSQVGAPAAVPRLHGP
jgi:hypothetical protein